MSSLCLLAVAISTGDARADDLVDSYLVPTKVRLRANANAPDRSRLVASGVLDLGSGFLVPSLPTRLEVGSLAFDVPSLEVVREGKYVLRGTGLLFTITLDRFGSSRARFRLSWRGEAAGEVDPDGDFVLVLTGGDIAARGRVMLSNGRASVGKHPGAILEPEIFITRLKAKPGGNGLGRLALKAGMSTAGGMPADAPELRFSFGTRTSVTVPAGEFLRGDESFVFVGASWAVLLDYRRGRILIAARKVDLGAVPSNPELLDLEIALGDDRRVVRVRIAPKGRSLRY